MAKKRIIYLSGPMRGKPGFNYDYFNRVEERILDGGSKEYKVLNPARHFDGEQDRTFAEYMAEDLKDILKADVVAMLPGWQDSEGARVEYTLAKSLGKEIAYVDGASMVEPPEMEASSLVRSGEREQMYGHPSEDFSRTAKLWSGVLGIEITPEQVALCMACLKISRLVGNPTHRDSLVDGVGYFAVYDRIIEDRRVLQSTQ